MDIYSASRSGSSFSEGIAAELKESMVTVTQSTWSQVISTSLSLADLGPEAKSVQREAAVFIFLYPLLFFPV